MSENIEQQAIFMLHYDGEKISNHKMKLDDFLVSLQGFDSLLKEISQQIGIPPECFQLEIQPLEQGGVKAWIVASLVGFTTFVAGHLGEHFFEDIRLYERSRLPHLAYRVNQFLDKKKSVSNYRDFAELTLNLDPEATRIMMNRQVHEAAETFIGVLGNNVDVLELSSNTSREREIITKQDLPNFRNPFVEPDLEERIYEEEKILRLDGPRSSESEWIFYEKNAQGKWDKKHIFRAIVLDPFLLSLGRENSLEALSDKDLYCKVRYREILKTGNKKKTIEKYIISCYLTPNLFEEKVGK